MNKRCEQCKREYDVSLSDAFHCFRFCTQDCEDATEAGRSEEMYLCQMPFSVTICQDGNKTDIEERVEIGSKWRRNDSAARGLCQIHLENISGKATGKLEWIEINSTVLIKCFQKL